MNINLVLSIVVVGTVLNFAVIWFCLWIVPPKDRVKFTNKDYLIFLCIPYYILFLFIGKLYYKYRKPSRKRNSHLVKTMIDEYWVNAVMYPNFDTNPTLPIKGCLLCEKYMASPKGPCPACPVALYGYACYNRDSLYKLYMRTTSDQVRQEAAVALGKNWEKVYRTLIVKEL